MSLFAGLVDAISGAESGLIALTFVMPLENLNKLHAASPDGTTLAHVAHGIYSGSIHGSTKGKLASTLPLLGPPRIFDRLLVITKGLRTSGMPGDRSLQL